MTDNISLASDEIEDCEQRIAIVLRSVHDIEAVIPDVAGLAKTELVRYCRQLAYARHSDFGKAYASESADRAGNVFSKDLGVVFRQQHQEVVRAVVYETIAWWRSNQNRSSKQSINGLVVRCSDQLSAELTLRNVSRAKVSSNMDWWSVLAHRFVERLIMPCCRSLWAAQVVDDWFIEEATSRYINIVLNSGSTYTHQSRKAGIVYFRSFCRNKELEKLREHSKYAEISLASDELLGNDELDTSYDRRWSSNEPNISTDDAEDRHEVWPTIISYLGRQSAICFWVVHFLRFEYDLSWSSIANLLLDAANLTVKYHTCVPDDVASIELTSAISRRAGNPSALKVWYCRALAECKRHN